MKKQTLFVLLSVLLFVFGTVSAANSLKEITDLQDTILLRLPYNGSNFELLIQFQSGEVTHGVLNAGYAGEELFNLGFESQQAIEKVFIWCDALLGNTVIELTQEEFAAVLSLLGSLSSSEEGAALENSAIRFPFDSKASFHLSNDGQNGDDLLSGNGTNIEESAFNVFVEALERYSEEEVIDPEVYFEEIPELPEYTAYTSEAFDDYANTVLADFRDATYEDPTFEIAYIDRVTIQPENAEPIINALADAFAPTLTENGYSEIIENIRAFAAEFPERLTQPIVIYLAFDQEEKTLFSDYYAYISSDDGIFLWNFYSAFGNESELSDMNGYAFLTRSLEDAEVSELVGEFYAFNTEDLISIALSSQFSDFSIASTLYNPWKKGPNDELFSLVGAFEDAESGLNSIALDLGYEDLSTDEGKVYKFPILLSVNDETVYDDSALVAMKETEKTTIIDPATVETVTLDQILMLLSAFSQSQENSVS